MAAGESVAPASAPKKVVSLVVRPDGVAVVTIDDPDATVNTIGFELGAELSAVMDRLERDASIEAAVVRSGKAESFVVGANIELLQAVKFAEEAERMAREIARGLVRLSKLPKPVVAAIHGPALGGGFELALACRAIVASDDAKTSVGLPEVLLGLLPAANGLLRVAARAGLKTAIDLGLTGRHVRARRAKAMGLVDEVCAPSILVDVAAARALGLASGASLPPRRRALPDELEALALEKNPLGRAFLFKKAREEAKKKTRGHYPAAERILDVLERYGSPGSSVHSSFHNKRFAAAAEVEAKAFGELVVSETSQRLIELFFARTALKKDAGVDDAGVTPRPIGSVFLLGGGLMGAGIAHVTASAGVPLRIKEKDDASLGRGLARLGSLLDARVAKRQIGALERDATLALVSGTTDYSGIRHASVVVEAVFEDLAAKQAILRDVEALTGEDTVFASNTSSIPIARIAQAGARPANVVGMHYFSPVEKMPLLEVVRTDETAPWVVATAVALGKRQGKTVIVVKDGVGFYTSRILAPYLNEAACMVAEGVPVESIDDALVDWGWKVGPLRLLDEVGIDVGAHVGAILHAAFGERMAPPSAMAKLVADDRKGRKNGRGFYTYGEGPAGVDRSVYRVIGVDPRGKLPAEEIQMRCSLQMINEAMHCIGEGILRSPRDGDVGAVFGLGFPPFRGGPFRYVDSIGAAEVLRRVQSYADRFGKRWAPAPALSAAAKKGSRFYA